MTPDRIARILRVGGIAAMITAPIPALAFFYKLATTKVNDIPQDQFAYHSTYWSAFLWLAGTGFALGLALLLIGWRLRPTRHEASA